MNLIKSEFSTIFYRILYYSKYHKPKAKRLEKMRKETLLYIEDLRDKNELYGRYRYAINQTACTLWASAFAALIRYLLDDLDTLKDSERQEWLDYLCSGQNPQTGLFIDPLFCSSDMNSKMHTPELLIWHSSTFILGAIDALGGKPIYPLYVVQKYRNPQAMINWIESLEWELNSWVVGNW